MRRRRLVAPVAAALVMFGLGACDPATHPLEIQISLHRDALVSAPGSGSYRTVVLTGVSWCTRSEPVDLFPTLRQGSVETTMGEFSVPCGPDRQEWSRAFELWEPAITPGPVRVDVEACTNPGDAIDEDCVSLGRMVTFTQVQ